MFSKPENMEDSTGRNSCISVSKSVSVRSGNRSRHLGISWVRYPRLQTAYQLVSPLISTFTIAQIVRDTVILEFSPTLVCIVLAGVVGSKIARRTGQYAGE